MQLDNPFTLDQTIVAALNAALLNGNLATLAAGPLPPSGFPDYKTDNANNTLYLGHTSGVTGAGITENTGVGTSCMTSVTTGHSNTCLGSFSLQHVTTGVQNTVVGAESLKALTTGANNTVVGRQSVQSLTTGSGNTVVGESSGVNLTSGGGNIYIGQASGQNTTTGNNNIVIGNGLQPTLPATNNWLNIAGVIVGDYTTGPAIKNGTTAITQAPGDNSQKLATTGYADALLSAGLNVTITTAALTLGGTQGSMTFTKGILTAQTPAT